MLKTMEVWKITKTDRTGDKDETKNIAIVFDEIEAKLLIEYLIEKIAGYNYRPFEWDRSYYHSNDKLQVCFSNSKGDKLFLGANKVNIAIEEA